MTPTHILNKARKEKPMGRTVQCLHCQHEWRTLCEGYDPRICPNCKHWYWNVYPELAPSTTR